MPLDIVKDRQDRDILQHRSLPLVSLSELWVEETVASETSALRECNSPKAGSEWQEHDLIELEEEFLVTAQSCRFRVPLENPGMIFYSCGNF